MRFSIEVPDSFASIGVGGAVNLTDGEQALLAEIFSQPIVKKYLQVLTLNQIKDAAEIPLDTLSQDGLTINAIKQAYSKGGLSILHTLLSIEKPQPSSVQATQQGQSQQR